MKERGRVTGATTTEASNGGNNSRNSQEYDASYMQKKNRDPKFTEDESSLLLNMMMVKDLLKFKNSSLKLAEWNQLESYTTKGA
jgi:hypothetical protein